MESRIITTEVQSGSTHVFGFQQLAQQLLLASSVSDGGAFQAGGKAVGHQLLALGIGIAHIHQPIHQGIATHHQRRHQSG